MESSTTSLYDVLHRQCLRLDRQSITHIALTVLQTLSFLHSLGTSFGPVLTSRKVVFTSAGCVQLRRFGLEWVHSYAVHVCGRELPAMSTSSLVKNSHYCPMELPPAGETARGDEATDAQRRDLFAFGVLLLEMCTGEKPTHETFNRLSMARQLDPTLGRIISLALNMDPRVHESDLDVSKPSSVLAHCLALLQESRDEVTHERRSICSFPSFIHADQYCLQAEADAVAKKLEERDRQYHAALQRLKAVEDELVEEQKNFEILARQVDQLNHENTQCKSSLSQSKLGMVELERMLADRGREFEAKELEITRFGDQLRDMQTALDERDQQLRRAFSEKTAIERERQELLQDILKLKDEKSRCLERENQLKTELEAITRKVGREKDALEELNARWNQARTRWEMEVAARQSIERRMESLNAQNLLLEEERCRFSAELQRSPLGVLNVRDTMERILELKEKEVVALRRELNDTRNQLDRTETELDAARREIARLEKVEILQLQGTIDDLTDSLEHIRHQIEHRDDEIQQLHQTLSDSRCAEEQLQASIASLEEQVAEERRKIAEMGENKLEMRSRPQLT
ncbi:hypothetical protein PINS_up019338 [Pythium insidiosum]|nr:hypothetical protein PINS_up019338 [Pythium insidiosum]